MVNDFRDFHTSARPNLYRKTVPQPGYHHGSLHDCHTLHFVYGIKKNGMIVALTLLQEKYFPQHKN